MKSLARVISFYDMNLLLVGLVVLQACFVCIWLLIFLCIIQTRLWIASIAFTLLFGTIFVKTWRVYYIFYSENRHRRGKKVVSWKYVDIQVVYK